MQTLTVLVTRPSHQNENLNRLLSDLGCEVIAFPTIAIEASTPTPFLQQLDSSIKSYDMALFVSRNAVDYTFRYLNVDKLPTNLQLGVIGKGSWDAMQEQGVSSHIIPADSYNSEGLLASPALQQVAGSKIIIFRGQQGRNLLGDTLLQRGASVEYCEVYRRVLPQYSKVHLAELTETHFPDVAIFTSAEGLSNAFKLLSGRQAERLRQTPWLLISERMRETARNLRHNADILIASRASDEGILQALKEWQQTKV